jgi:hypothetical protein
VLPAGKDAALATTQLQARKGRLEDLEYRTETGQTTLQTKNQLV